MSDLVPLLTAGLCLGALGALGHLAVVAWRVALLLGGRPERARRAWPLGLLGPGAVVLLAAWWAAPVAWGALAGLILTRWCVLSRAGRWP